MISLLPGNDVHSEVMELLGSLLGHVFQSMTDWFFPTPTNMAVNLMYPLLPKEWIKRLPDTKRFYLVDSL
jgi:hypothetical protein